MNTNSGTFEVIVKNIELVTPLIKVFTLAAIDGRPLPGFSGGSHVVVLIPSMGKIYRNPYSLMSSPFDTTSYQIGVRRSGQGRGGSIAMHDEIQVGSILKITHPVNNFPLNKLALKHIFIAGGVGITPVISQEKDLQVGQIPYEIHYTATNPEHGAMQNFLEENALGKTALYFNSVNKLVNFRQILENQPLGSHVYICGPAAMIVDVVAVARQLGWSASHIHWEEFVEQQTGVAFDVRLNRSNVTVSVPPELSLLEAIEGSGIDVPYLCRGGACGHCETTVLEIDGELIHNDIWLSEEQKNSKQKIMPCVSRAHCSKLVLDL